MTFKQLEEFLGKYFAKANERKEIENYLFQFGPVIFMISSKGKAYWRSRRVESSTTYVNNRQRRSVSKGILWGICRCDESLQPRLYDDMAQFSFGYKQAYLREM